MNTPPKEATEAPANRVLDEKTVVNTAEVDAVGGAKPEPEERPVVDALLLEPNKVALSNGAEIDSMKKMELHTIRPVGDMLESFGKYCKNCKHFNWQLGQREVLRINVQGSPQEKLTLKETRANFFETQYEESGTDILAPASDVFHDESDTFISQLGLCAAMSSFWQDACLVHPAQQTCPQDVPFMYEAKDAEQERRDTLLRDQLLGVASGKLVT